MRDTAKNILALGLAALLIAVTVVLIRYSISLSTGLMSSESASNSDLAPPHTALDKPNDKAALAFKPPAFRVPLAVVPGSARLPHLATADNPASTPQLQAPPAILLPETADVPIATHSDLDVAMHPSLKYSRNWATVAPKSTISTAALDVPIVSLGKSATASAGHSAPAASPSNAEGSQAEMQKLIDANLKMEEDRRFVMAMCEDHQGCLWVGTEGGGVQRFDPCAPELHQWTQFTTKDGLGDDNGYAIACDRLGRIWVGHLNHGVSVFNGKKWQCYEVVGGLSRPETLSGPIGERVFAIKVCPTDGDVWIATNYGLARYSESKHDWTYYTRADGPPSDQIGCLAFSSDETLFAGTQCDGIAIAHAADDFKSWHAVRGPDEEPTEAAGPGLPSNLINDLCVLSSGTVVAAADCGIAASYDHGTTWSYVRGADWSQKVRGRVGGAPRNWKPNPAAAVLAEDYATSIAEAGDGQIWIGHRKAATELVDAKTLWTLRSLEEKTFATCLLPGPTIPTIGTYGDGVSGIVPRASIGIGPRTAALPLSALTTVAADAAQRPTEPASLAGPAVVYLGENWSTGGDWVGRYGRQYAILFAANWPFDQYISHGAIYYSVKASNGPNHPGKKDVLRRWTGRRDTTELRSLYDPQVGHRVQSEIDDHGEVYPAALSGPDIHIWVSVPEGVNAISLYFVSDDGHSSRDSDRDYLIRVAEAHSPGGDAIAPVLATARVRNFWGGVYERFAVRGPAVYRFEIQRHHSMNATCCGLFVDRIAGPSTLVDGMPFPSMGEIRYDPPPGPADAATAKAPRLAAARDLWSRADSNQIGSPSLARQQQVLALRMAAAAGPDQLAGWRWQLRLWNEDDRKAFDIVTKEGWASFADQMGMNKASAQ